MKNQIYKGKRNNYHWIEWHDGALFDLLTPFPEILQDQFLVNTSYDSGLITLTQDRIELGWKRHGTTTLIPPLLNIDDFPYDQFDEWFLFVSPTVIENYQPFINYLGFSLQNSDYKTLQEQFWPLVERIAPESYLAEGNNLIWITKNKELFDKVDHTI